MKKGILYTIIVTLLALPATKSFAQTPSYIYIQGDKVTPFYVKMDGKMQPRYGKNYAIISPLPAGTVTLEILFQQNIYPTQKFTIDVPAGGYRGFLLSKHNNTYDLYDLETKTYFSGKK